MTKIQQTYKNRAEALRFLRGLGFRFSERKFYGDCDANEMLEPDKSIKLAKLLAYLWEYYPPIPTTSDEEKAEHRAEEMSKLELDEKRLKVAKLQREDDHVKNLEKQVSEHRRQLAALLLYFYHTVKYHLGKSPSVIAAALGADQTRVAEIAVQIEEGLDRAMNEIAQNKKILQIEVVDDEPARVDTVA